MPAHSPTVGSMLDITSLLEDPTIAVNRTHLACWSVTIYSSLVPLKRRAKSTHRSRPLSKVGFSFENSR